MELKVVEEKEKELTVSVVGVDDTLMHPLLAELLKNEKVAEAKYLKGHPELDVPSVYIKVTSGDPKTALKKAAENVNKEFTDLKSKIEKKSR
jgi:DNA-directed RNA polymerase subunit L